jgi:SAM-dependent methyltransferase
MTEYLFGYDAKEFRRLAAQHRVWLPHTQKHWKTGGIQRGDVVLDLGCGPGFASTDLTKEGVRVLACDRSDKSLRALDARCNQEGIEGIQIYPACDALELPEFDVRPTAVYMRWMLCYLGAEKTEALFRKLPLDPAGRLLVHDYINYRSARLKPFSESVQSAIETFSRTLPDADIGFALPAILDRCGFEITWKRIVVLAISPGDPEWSWPNEFFELHAGLIEDSEAFLRDWRQAAQNLGTLFFSWPVLQLVAVKR